MHTFLQGMEKRLENLFLIDAKRCICGVAKHVKNRNMPGKTIIDITDPGPKLRINWNAKDKMDYKAE